MATRMDYRGGLLLLLSSLLVLRHCTAKPDPNAYQNCTYSKGNFTAKSTYQTNLNLLLSSLSSNAKTVSGFYNTTTGQNPDKVYGLFLCRGDVTLETCNTCIKAASSNITQRCPTAKEAIIWYEYCMLRYSNQPIFSIMEKEPSICLPGNYNVPNLVQSEFDKTWMDLFNGLVSQAASSAAVLIGRKYAANEANYTKFEKIYGLVQCTPDLSQDDCYKCLADAVSYIPICCQDKIGGRLNGPSCFVRYENNYSFYRTLASTTVTEGSVPSTEANRGRNSSVITIAVVGTFTTAILISFLYLCSRRRKLKPKTDDEDDQTEIVNANSLQFNFCTIRAATNNFSDANKLGKGGFGVVYKGKLLDGQMVAVKRLSSNSGQGETEFKNEVLLMVKLQHKNLVRLLGFYLEGEEKLLIYEFMPNTSLDHFIFDPIKRSQLDWEKRYKIIEGIARGLLYLHEDSRLKIIHRDLKASNILLDEEMNPKIADFGMARLFGVDQTQANTSKVVGTRGYIAPEYINQGKFSIKIDVYSFGVLLLEIVSGERNNNSNQSRCFEGLPSYAWKKWKEGTALALIDHSLRDNCDRSEVIKCIHIGLLCVQENVSKKPTMASVVLMLNRYSATLPVPSSPAFLMDGEIELAKPSMEGELRVTKSGESTSKSATKSINEVSITELSAR